MEYATEWSGTEASIEVQVSFGLHSQVMEGMAKTIYPTWQGKFNNAKLHYSVALKQKWS